MTLAAANSQRKRKLGDAIQTIGQVRHQHSTVDYVDLTLYLQMETLSVFI